MGEILFLAHRVPFPPDRGDKIRGFHVLKHLAQRHRVHLVAFADDARDMAPQPEFDALLGGRVVVWRGKSQLRALAEALVTNRPASVAAFAHSAVARGVAKVLEQRSIDAIYVFSSQMAQYLPTPCEVPVVMDFVDVDSAKFAVYAESSRWPRNLLYAREASTLLAHDAHVAAQVDASVFVSEAEAALFRRETGAGNVVAIENGIDTAAFDPQHVAPTPTDHPLILFTGQMDYRPNIDAATWFAEAILPRIREHVREARFAIVGRAPSDAVLALAREPGVTVTGEVPDVRPWLAAADVVVAPLKLARGIQNKVLEAMAMARPVIASTSAAEGIDHDGTIAVAADAEDFTRRTVALLRDPEAAQAAGTAARRRVCARYGWDAALAPLDGLLGLASAARRTAA